MSIPNDFNWITYNELNPDLRDIINGESVFYQEEHAKCHYINHGFFENRKYKIDNLENIYTFIPRDAGFFSVFNFFIGSISLGYRMYPYFNLNKLLEYYGKLEHFTYLDNKENCWFDFFEPIQYYTNDNKHINININNKISHGWEAPEEFRLHQKVTELITNSKFKEWRHNTNKVFEKYIKFNPIIINKINEITKLFSNKMIAVHYRNPAHCCEESGYKYFDDYFKKIDNILSIYPDAFIFLATDTDFGIAAFTMRYGSKIIYNKETLRSSMNNILEWAYTLNDGVKSDHVGFFNGKSFQIHNNSNSNIQLGYDVIIDAVCISKCNYFIHTTSNISLAVSYMNPDLEMIYI